MTAEQLPAVSKHVAPLPPWMQELRAAVKSELKSDDLSGIVRAFVDKAKKGDERAARFVIEYLLGGKLAPTEVTVHNHYAAEPARTIEAVPQVEKPATNGTAEKKLTPQAARNKVADYLQLNPGVTPAAISGDLKIPMDVVLIALDSEWFEESRGKWSIRKTKG